VDKSKHLPRVSKWSAEGSKQLREVSKRSRTGSERAGKVSEHLRELSKQSRGVSKHLLGLSKHSPEAAKSIFSRPIAFLRERNRFVERFEGFWIEASDFWGLWLDNPQTRTRSY
jgi:hypothetical protein